MLCGKLHFIKRIHIAKLCLYNKIMHKAFIAGEFSQISLHFGPCIPFVFALCICTCGPNSFEEKQHQVEESHMSLGE